MKRVDSIFKFAHVLLRMVVVMAAASFLIYGAYVIFDTLGVEQHAFVSSDLLKYKPKVTSTVETVSYDFEDLQEINNDVVGWLEIKDTHIDYPVLQGKDELEYATKDPFGNNSITGSIYLSSANNRDFDDFYNVIYGHNMDVGAMFGDITKYLDEDYFNSHRTGVLYTDDKSYNFNIYAVLKTDAYQEEIYTSNVQEKEAAEARVDYINANLIHGEIKGIDDLTKILVFSTCESAETNGRVVVVADAIPSGRIKAGADLTGSGQLGERKKGLLSHKVAYWSLLNLLCMIGAFLTLCPLTFVVKKIKMFGYSKKVKKEIDEDYELLAPYITDEDGSDKMWQKFQREVRRFRRKINIGIVIEILMSIATIVVFVLYEDMTKKVVLSDQYTPFMLAAFGLSVVTDIICFTYRGLELPEIIDTIIGIGV